VSLCDVAVGGGFGNSAGLALKRRGYFGVVLDMISAGGSVHVFCCLWGGIDDAAHRSCGGREIVTFGRGALRINFVDDQRKIEWRFEARSNCPRQRLDGFRRCDAVRETTGSRG